MSLLLVLVASNKEEKQMWFLANKTLHSVHKLCVCSLVLRR